MPDYNMLFQAPNAGQAFAQSFQQAQQVKQRNALMQQEMQERQEDRQTQMQDRERQERARLLAEAREQLGMTARLLDSARDPVSYQQARQAAAGIPGFDVSQVPEQYDPNWIAQTKMQVQALSGQVEQELMAVAPGTTVIDKRTGQKVFTNPRPPRYIPVQAGGKLVLDPSSVEGAELPHSAGEDEWEYEGGSTPQASTNFPY
jgi:hypothetical protein